MTTPPPSGASTNASGGKPLAGRRIVVALTGGIACYKVCTVVSRLVQAGAEVRVLMTEAATHFVGPLTLQSLSGHTVLTTIWQADDHPESQHIGIARWAQLMLIAPLSANTLAKLAAGLTDDVVSLTAAALPRDPEATPVLLAPAMNSDMWANPIVQRNLQTVRDLLGYETIGPESGWQACRTSGAGRMSEPDTIIAAVVSKLTK